MAPPFMPLDQIKNLLHSLADVQIDAGCAVLKEVVHQLINYIEHKIVDKK